MNDYNKKFEKPIVFAVKHKNLITRLNSRSGGIFTAISDYFLDDGGVVYGCILDEKFNAVHMRADNKLERDKMMGSKYIQSNIGDTFKKVRSDLDAGKRVLFTGTSCQVAGLLNFIGESNQNLLCVDIVCHGVPSSKVLHDYIKWQEKKVGAPCVGIDFRNKKDYGWNSHIETLMFANGTRISSEVFKNLFYGHQCLRPACYKCPFKSIIHPGDITIADYWGIDKAAPGFNDNKGVSLVLINNKFGNEIFGKLKNIECKECRIEDSMQPPLEAPFPEPKNRSRFWTDFERKSFNYIAARYGGNSFWCRSKRFIKKVLGRALY